MFRASSFLCYFIVGTVYANTIALGQEAVAPTTNAAAPFFRPGHQLTSLTSVEYSRWKIKNAGSVTNVTENAVIPGLAMRYGYHFNILSKFGVILGTSTQLLFSRYNWQGFTPGMHYIFPSVSGGIVQNFRRNTRISLHADYSAIWFPYLKTKGDDGRSVTISSIPDTFSLWAHLEHFITETQALSVLIGWRTVTNTCLENCSHKGLASGLEFDSSAVVLQLGTTFHLTSQREL